MSESFVSIYVFLLPAVGYIWFSRKHSLERHIKPLSGIELTYSSAGAGVVFFAASFAILRFVNCLVLYYGNERLLKLRSEMLGLFPSHGVIYFFGAFVLAFLASRLFLRGKGRNKSVFLGESKLSEIWYDLSSRGAELVIFLKNGKCYIGLLDTVEVSERIPVNERVVSIVVARSGFRTQDGTVSWNTSYNSPIVHYFSMSEIVNFAEYISHATFDINKPAKPAKTKKR